MTTEFTFLVGGHAQLNNAIPVMHGLREVSPEVRFRVVSAFAGLGGAAIEARLKLFGLGGTVSTLGDSPAQAHQLVVMGDANPEIAAHIEAHDIRGFAYLDAGVRYDATANAGLEAINRRRAMLEVRAGAVSARDMVADGALKSEFRHAGVPGVSFMQMANLGEDFAALCVRLPARLPEVAAKFSVVQAPFSFVSLGRPQHDTGVILRSALAGLAGLGQHVVVHLGNKDEAAALGAGLPVIAGPLDGPDLARLVNLSERVVTNIVATENMASFEGVPCVLVRERGYPMSNCVTSGNATLLSPDSTAEAFAAAAAATIGQRLPMATYSPRRLLPRMMLLR